MMQSEDMQGKLTWSLSRLHVIVVMIVLLFLWDYSFTVLAVVRFTLV